MGRNLKLIIATVLILHPCKTKSEEFTECKTGICVEFVGFDIRSLLSVFSSVEADLQNKAVLLNGKNLTSNGIVRVMDIIREPKTGIVKSMELSKGDLFFGVYPSEGRATASANLDMGFEYRIDLNATDGVYRRVSSGIDSTGAKEFKVEKAP